MRGHVVWTVVTVVLLTSHQLHASLKKLASNRFRSRHGIGGSNKSPTYRRAGIHKNKHQSNMWQRSHGHDLHPPRKMVGHRSNNHLSTMDAPVSTVIHRNLRQIPALRNEKLMCPGLCLEENSPFCAMDGLNATKTFFNNCLMEQENCRKRKAFLCISVSVAESVGKCSINCSNSYEPLCAGNSSKNQTFHNSCVFITYQCLYPEKHYMKLKDGECTERPRRNK